MAMQGLREAQFSVGTTMLVGAHCYVAKQVETDPAAANGVGETRVVFQNPALLKDNRATPSPTSKNYRGERDFTYVVGDGVRQEGRSQGDKYNGTYQVSFRTPNSCPTPDEGTTQSSYPELKEDAVGEYIYAVPETGSSHQGKSSQ